MSTVSLDSAAFLLYLWACTSFSSIPPWPPICSLGSQCRVSRGKHIGESLLWNGRPLPSGPCRVHWSLYIIDAPTRVGGRARWTGWSPLQSSSHPLPLFKPPSWRQLPEVCSLCDSLCGWSHLTATHAAICLLLVHPEGCIQRAPRWELHSVSLLSVYVLQQNY